MKIEEIKQTCTGCGACASVCPRDCIKFEFDKEGFYYPTIDKSNCIECGLCEKKCHVLNFSVPDAEKTTYYGYTRDDALRHQSTSGGAFSAIAENILESGGKVYGAYLDCKTCDLKHTSTDEVDIGELRKSKYLESYMGTTIKNIQTDIDLGRRVMFCGTPCQTAAVKKAVTDKENLLLTVDFICHGVPSAKLFKEHMQNVLGKRSLRIINFRSKIKGWRNIRLQMDINGSEKIKPAACDTFYYGFISMNAFLRKSCYDCKYREVHCSDITIADFWGYRNVDPGLDDGKGLSLIVANNELGRNIVRSMHNFELTEIDNKFSDYAYAPKDLSSGKALRDEFYRNYEKYGFEKAAKKTYMQDYAMRNIKYIIKHLMGRE